ncbi:MAG: thioredoxin [Phycisphaerae bacterium]|nr:thioredoxin [Phycisphaerae bacterium]MBM91362.1 thioredoxin [Phycisphaerae bacterium]
MATQTVIEITDQNFDTLINSSTPTLVDFWAPWCGPCRALGPTIEKLADDYEGKAQVGKLNIDEHPQLAAKFGVASIPTVIVFKEGQATKQFVGLRQYDEYAETLG